MKPPRLVFVLLGFGLGLASAYLHGLARGEEDAEAPVAYAGSRRCRMCHITQEREFRVSAHATTFERIPEAMHEDPSCVACHATGTGAEGGFRSPEETPDQAGVQCEACHGGGRRHVDLARRGLLDDNVDEITEDLRAVIGMPKNVCASCHRIHEIHPAIKVPAEGRGR